MELPSADHFIGALLMAVVSLSGAVVVLWRHGVNRQKLDDERTERMVTIAASSVTAMQGNTEALKDLRAQIKENHDQTIGIIIKATTS